MPRRFRFSYESQVVSACCASSPWMARECGSVEHLSEPALRRIFDAHRQMIELRAAQKLNAGLLDSDGSVLIDADDI